MDGQWSAEAEGHTIEVQSKKINPRDTEVCFYIDGELKYRVDPDLDRSEYQVELEGNKILIQYGLKKTDRAPGCVIFSNGKYLWGDSSVLVKTLKDDVEIYEKGFFSFLIRHYWFLFLIYIMLVVLRIAAGKSYIPTVLYAATMPVIIIQCWFGDWRNLKKRVRLAEEKGAA